MRQGFLKLSNKCTALHHTVCALNMHFKRNIHAGSEWMRVELKYLDCAIILHLQHNSLVAYGTPVSFVMIERNGLQRHFNRIKIKWNTCFQKHTVVYAIHIKFQFTNCIQTCLFMFIIRYYGKVSASIKWIKTILDENSLEIWLDYWKCQRGPHAH